MLRLKLLVPVTAFTMAMGIVGCATKTDRANNAADVKTAVRNDLDAANLKGVKVDFDKDKNVVTLTGDAASDEQRAQAAEIAKKDAAGMVIANEIGVRPAGAETEAKKIDSNIDDAIEKEYKAILIGNKLDHSGIDFKAKNGTLELTGKVDNARIRTQAQQLAKNVPNVGEIVNKIQVKHAS
ncbi:MAG: hypothetical protein NVS9B15_21450 [Acidobacteriaceae bacterium]